MKLKLNGYLAHQALSQIEKKGLFRGKYFWLGEYLGFATATYETSSVLGYTYRDKFSTLIELIAEDGGVNNLMNYITTPATNRISELKDTPNNFYELFFEKEAIDIMKMLLSTNQIEHDNWHDFLPKNFKLKISLGFAFSKLQMTVAEGIGFGYKYPELTEKFLSYKYDESTKAKWRKWFNHGLDIGAEPPENPPLQTLQLDAKKLIKPFIEMVRPDLLETLELNNL